MIYFDNASTSYPKPVDVIESIQEYLTGFGVSPGRGLYSLSDKAEDLTLQTRKMLVELIGGDQINNLIFTGNATHSLNMVIKGFLQPGDHVLICSYSHNSVIRPVDSLMRKGLITYDIFEIDSDGNIDHENFINSFKVNTRLVICNHASNVIGVVSPIEQISKICKLKNVSFLLDCTQSLGYFPINVNEMGIDFLVGTGHKTLCGPTGIGFLYLKDPQSLDPFFEGGTGRSYSLSKFHPTQMPYKLEAGTLNMTCIAGLYGALKYISRVGFEAIHKKAIALTTYAWDQLNRMGDVILYGTSNMTRKVPIISFNLSDSLPNEMAFLYSQHYNICLRSGVQCAPLIHQTLGTLPTGTIRIGLSHFNNSDEIDQFKIATQEIIKQTLYPEFL